MCWHEYEWVMQTRRIKMGKLREWAGKNLRAGDVLVIEIAANVCDIYNIVAPLATRTLAAHVGAVWQIAEARDVIRKRVDHLEVDRPLYSDHNKMKALVKPGELLYDVEKVVGSLGWK